MSEGLVVVDKPAGWTSHDVVARGRRLYRTKKVGHAGTLDPMATGVLVLGVGRGTKLLTFLVGADKEYTATIRLGQATITDDAEGEVTAVGDVAGTDRPALDAAVARLTGDIEQVPSSVSAIKVKGERSYARVRAGEQVELAARPVRVSRFDVLDVRSTETEGHPVLDVDVVVELMGGIDVPRPLLLEALGVPDLGGHALAQATGDDVGEGLGVEHVGRGVDQVAGQVHGLGDNHCGVVLGLVGADLAHGDLLGDPGVFGHATHARRARVVRQPNSGVTPRATKRRPDAGRSGHPAG